jgi:hypothetical protein
MCQDFGNFLTYHDDLIATFYERWLMPPRFDGRHRHVKRMPRGNR